MAETLSTRRYALRVGGGSGKSPIVFLLGKVGVSPGPPAGLCSPIVSTTQIITIGPSAAPPPSPIAAAPPSPAAPSSPAAAAAPPEPGLDVGLPVGPFGGSLNVGLPPVLSGGVGAGLFMVGEVGGGTGGLSEAQVPSIAHISLRIMLIPVLLGPPYPFASHRLPGSLPQYPYRLTPPAYPIGSRVSQRPVFGS